jgi:hypothetical protein
LLLFAFWTINIVDFYISTALLYWTNTFFWSALLTVAWAVGIHFQYAMLKHHNYEFQRHKWRFLLQWLIYVCIAMFELT